LVLSSPKRRVKREIPRQVERFSLVDTHDPQGGNMKPLVTKAFVSIGLVMALVSGPGRAQSSADPGSGLFSFGDFNFSIGEKAWFASWDTRLIDARVVIPSAGATPVIQSSSISRVDEHVIPITNLGVKYSNFSLATAIYPTTRFSSGEANTGSISRSEYDVTLGYAITPSLTAALVYKGGKVSQTTTDQATRLTGLSGDAKLRGVLLGLFGSAPIAEGWRLYGTAAFGPGHADARLQTGQVPNRFTYSIGEVGMTYVIPNQRIGAITLNAGYRIQVIRLKDFNLPTYSLSRVELSSERHDVSTTTQGPIIGITLNFL
jgi:hypothetical protein